LEKAGWHADWISAAEGIVRAEFEHLYATLPSGTNNEESPLPESKKSKVHTGLSSHICFKPKSIAMYRTFLMMSLLSQHQRPLNSMMNLHSAHYLSTDPELVKDVLLWWHKHKATYPHLSRTVLDYLTIPGESY
jgi:hypothetical protein